MRHIMDLFIVIFYLISTLFLGIYFGQNIRTLKDFATSSGYSTNVLLATLFATVIGGGSTLGIVTNVHRYGIIFMFAFMGASSNKYLVAYYVAPKLQKLKHITSLGDVFENSYGKFGRVISGLCVFFVSVACIGHQTTAIGFVFKCFFDIDFVTGVLLAYGTLVVYSSFGGIRSVVATDVYQFALICAFVPIVLLVCLAKIGGINAFLVTIPSNKIDLATQLTYWPQALTIFFMMLFSGLDPGFIHRIIMAKEVNQGKYITKMTGHFSFLIFSSMGLIGLCSYILFPHIESNIALPHMIKETLPPILKGIAISGLLATLMSTADTALHVLGVSVCEDLILTFKANFTEKQKIALVRVITTLMGLLSLGVALYFQDIFSIMVFAFSFWGPTVLIPFIMILYGYVFEKRELLIGTILGLATVVIWTYTLKDYTNLSGFIPGSLCNFIFFLICILKRNWYVQKAY